MEISENETVVALNPGDILQKLDHIRRNHALEHATLHVIAAGGQRKRVAGYSDLSGFYLIGDVATADVERAAAAALERLKRGEKKLAYHPQCGTNYSVTALLGMMGVLVSLIGVRKKGASLLDRLPLIYLLLILSTFFGPILGRKVQQGMTTNPDPGEITLGEIRRVDRGSLVVHHVRTQSNLIEGGLCRLIWKR